MNFDGKIGGMETKIEVDVRSKVNSMSKGLFRKLRVGRHRFFTADEIALKIGDFDYCGQFTSKVEINGQFSFVTFYVREGEEDLAIINKKIAHHLKLMNDH